MEIHGLLKSAIRDDKPVLFFVDIALLYAAGPVAADAVASLLGHAVVRPGTDTGRLIVVPEAPGSCGVAAEIAALVGQQACTDLRAPVVRLTGPDAPAAASFPLEHADAPSADAVMEAARKVMEFV